MGLFDDNTVCPVGVLSLRDLIPDRYFDPNDDTTDRFVEVFQGVLCQWFNDIDGLNKIYDLDLTDERFLDLIIKNLGFDVTVSLSEPKKRRLAKVIVQSYKQKGTCKGVENTIRQFVGVDAKCFAFTEGWILDVSELDLDTYLNPAPDNVAGFYTFDVIVSQKLSAEQRRIIEVIVNLIKPAHSHFRDLVEEGEDPFVLSILVFVNRASLYLYREQNNDGGWDANETDGSTLNVSSIEDAGYHAIGEIFAYQFNTELQRVLETFQEGAEKLINDATYVFNGVKPKESDIFLLNKAVAFAVAGATAKRDEAIDALIEFAKAMAFLNSYTATPAELASTTQPERDSTTQRKRSQFLYLYLTNNFGLGEGVYRYVRYMRDLIEIGEDVFGTAMAEELFFRVAGINLSSDFGQTRILACAAIGWGLAQFNTGFQYDAKISEVVAIIDGDFQVVEKLYFNLGVGTGRMIEQAIVLDLWMARGRFDQAKALIDGIRLQQRIEGSVDDPVDPGTAKLRGLGAVLDSVARAIKKIDDEGL